MAHTALDEWVPINLFSVILANFVAYHIVLIIFEFLEYYKDTILMLCL